MGVQFAGNILASSAGGPLPISMGGTGQTNAPAALNALLPNQTGQATKVLTSDGTDVSWQDAGTGGGTPGGADTQIQFNDAGTFGGISTFTVNKSTGALASTATFAGSAVYSSAAAGSTRTLGLQTAGSNRWLLNADSTAESGANAGSDFALLRVNDNGATTNQVLTITRSTGVVDFKTTPTVNGTSLVYTLPTASTSTLGGVKVDGTTITIDGNGVISGSGPAAAGSLTGTTLASNVVSSSLTSVGTLTSLAVTGSITTGGVAVGYLTVPQNAQGNYTCVLADSGKHIYTASGGVTYTIPANASVAYPVGTAITFVNQSTSNVTIAITSDTMYLAGTAGTTGSRTLGQYGVATALKVAATVWMISGTSLT